MPSGTHRGSAGEQRLKHSTSHTCFAAGCRGNLREWPGVGAEPRVIDNFIVAAWMLLPFSPQIPPPP